jgi:hypothetical protein
MSIFNISQTARKWKAILDVVTMINGDSLAYGKAHTELKDLLNTNIQQEAHYSAVAEQESDNKLQNLGEYATEIEEQGVEIDQLKNDTGHNSDDEDDEEKKEQQEKFEDNENAPKVEQFPPLPDSEENSENKDETEGEGNGKGDSRGNDNGNENNEYDPNYDYFNDIGKDTNSDTPTDEQQKDQQHDFFDDIGTGQQGGQDNFPSGIGEDEEYGM